ncbi:MAG: hypothetical protein ABI452_01235 [Candidatus Limnocylindrales bacterium]
MLRIITGLAACALVLACSGGPAASPISATVKEWQISLSATNIKAGAVTFNINNDGDKDHEFVVVRTDLAADALPTTGTGEVDEEGTGFDAIGELEDIKAGTSANPVTLTLTPGKYVVFCNVYAEDLAHYQKGMRLAFTVSS